MNTKEIEATIKSWIGRRGIDTKISVDLGRELKAAYPGGFDLDCLDASDFMTGGLFNETEAQALLFLATQDGQKDLDTLAHLAFYGF